MDVKTRFKHLYHRYLHHLRHQVDPARIGIAGESGGGYICAGAMVIFFIIIITINWVIISTFMITVISPGWTCFQRRGQPCETGCSHCPDDWWLRVHIKVFVFLFYFSSFGHLWISSNIYIIPRIFLACWECLLSGNQWQMRRQRMPLWCKWFGR